MFIYNVCVCFFYKLCSNRRNKIDNSETNQQKLIHTYFGNKQKIVVKIKKNEIKNEKTKQKNYT